MVYPLRWSWYPVTWEGKENKLCAQPCPRAAESDPFPEPSHALVKILEATKESWNWFFHRRERVIPMNFQLQLPPWPVGLALKWCFGLRRAGYCCCQSIWTPFKAGGWNLRCSQASPRNWTGLPLRSPAGHSQTWEPSPVIAVSILTVPVSSARSLKRVLMGVGAAVICTKNLENASFLKASGITLPLWLCVSSWFQSHREVILTSEHHDDITHSLSTCHVSGTALSTLHRSLAVQCWHQLWMLKWFSAITETQRGRVTYPRPHSFYVIGSQDWSQGVFDPKAPANLAFLFLQSLWPAWSAANIPDPMGEAPNPPWGIPWRGRCRQASGRRQVLAWLGMLWILFLF